MIQRSVMLRLSISAALMCTWASAHADDAKWNIERNERQLAIRHGDRRVAEFVFQNAKILRPFFANVHAPNGVAVSRSHPPVAGKDAMDHDTMHPGLWLAFGDISGTDFWRNKGRIRHVRFSEEPKGEKDAISFANECVLETAAGKPVGSMTNRLRVQRRPSGWLFLWDATFSAGQQDLVFGDQEEMGFGARMATPLTEKKGGTILNSRGMRSAKETWGKPAAWCDYSGTIDGKRVGMLLMESPKNFRESWWHNRDYGVFVANPFGRAAMNQGGRSEVTITKGDSLRLAFGALAHEGEPIDLDGEYGKFVEACPR